MSDATDNAAGPVYLNRAQIARALGVTPPTIDAYVAKGMPVAKKGSNGRSYEFDLDAVLAWRRGEDKREADERARQEAAIREQQLQLIGGSAGDSDMGLSPAKRRELWDEQSAYMRTAKERRELIPRAEVEAAFEETFRVLAQALQGLPDILGRRCALTPEAIVEVQKAVDSIQAEIADKLESESNVALAHVA
jgi:phage terminase Nu1 subunit (DNA packaging protein)